jgi:hypothetical protein
MGISVDKLWCMLVLMGFFDEFEILWFYGYRCLSFGGGGFLIPGDEKTLDLC